MAQIVMGTCDGTGAAIHVCLGWVPDFVTVWNLEDAGSLSPVATWTKFMSLVSAQDEGELRTGLSDTDFDLTALAANGISAYNGGDTIVYDADTDKRWETTAGASAEELYVYGGYKRTATSDPAYKCFGYVAAGRNTGIPHGTKVTTVPGFNIGTDSNLNADGEQLSWIAIKAD